MEYGCVWFRVGGDLQVEEMLQVKGDSEVEGELEVEILGEPCRFKEVNER